MQNRHIIGQARVRVPAQQMLMERAGLARSIVVANVMVVGLGQWSMAEAEDQEADPERAHTRCGCPPTLLHPEHPQSSPSSASPIMSFCIINLGLLGVKHARAARLVLMWCVIVI